MSSKTKSEKTDKSEKALAAEKEQFVKLQLQSIGKSITTAEAPLKEKYVRKILLGTHKEGGAVTFWSHAVSLPLSSNAILSWKFCHMVHKLLRDGHPNTARDSRGHVPSIKQMGALWGNLHDRYGHIVALYAKFLGIKIDFHCKHKEIPANLETPDEVLERVIAVDINQVFETTGEVLEYMDAALILQDTVFRQLESNSISSTTLVGQCRLAPLVLLIQDCSPIYHLLVKLLFKLHSRIPVDALLGHRERFREQFNSLTQFFEKARSMEFFKKIIQIPDLPDNPPNFLRAASLADHVKPVVVRNQELPDDDDTETQLDFGEVPGYQMFYAYNQYDPTNDGLVQRETETESLRKELEAMKPELQMFKAEAQRAVVQLKEHVNKLESELEEQRTQKQMALVENEHLRMEVEALRSQSSMAANIQASAEDAGSRAQAAQMYFSRLKEKHAELVTRHADLMRKNADAVKQLNSAQQIQEELIRTRQQMAEELEQLRQDKSTKAVAHNAEIVRLKQELQSGKAEITQVQSVLQSKEMAGDQLSSVLVGLQAEKDALLRSLKEQETELNNLRQAAQLHQTSLQQERERSQRDMNSLQSQLQGKVYREQEQHLELEKLKRELELKKAEALSAQMALQSKEVTGDQLSSVLVGLQTEKDALLRTLKEQETELHNLRQAAHLHQATLQQEREKSQREISSLQSQLQQILRREQEQLMEITRLKGELEERRAEAWSAQSALQSKESVGNEINSVLVGLQAEKDVLLRSVKEQEAELSTLRQAAKLHQATLIQERERSQRETSSLQSQLQAKSSRESMLQQKLQDEQFCLLQCAVVEAEGIILDAVAKVDDPMHVRCVSTPEYLINRAQITLVSIDKMQQMHAGYLRNMDDASGLLRGVTQFSHLAADTIVNGAATAHSVPTDQADRLTDSCRDCATHCLQFLKELKLKPTLLRADPTAIRYVVQRILNQGHDLRKKGADVQKSELADLVDQEMIATSTAIEDAVLRMDEILNQARKETTGLKLEVNQSIIGSCSDLMKAIHMLVTAATDLQKDIVESGRGAGSVKDFYAKNSCWTEGLISASKTVGWAATQMVESADKVVTEKGKYEELIVCSHEIAASTAQLVAASKVKADRSNKKLHTLQQASRHVNDMAAVVVTSTKTGQMQINDKNPMDFSGLSLVKLKTEEMDSQVRVLELESQLSNERQRLGELRKKHYEMAGVPLDQPVERNIDGFFSVLPPDMPELPLPDPPLPEFLLPEYPLPQFPLPDLPLPPLPDLPLPDPPMPEPPMPEPPKPVPPKGTSSKRSIFQKSGTLLKNAFR
ncbi:huntingtin-interacting protein 1-related protein-like [Hoplias malabaricus]|uniref:huntingtin-interacting protein 1-related protein-like n=1 Tax=Hoplias malabaricus TaxID=27720 RepID=UPI00346319EA